MKNSKPTTLLFDLDGTLLDTAPDFVYIINSLLERHQRSSLPAEIIRAEISRGAAGMLQRAFDIDTHHANFPILHQQFLNLYAENLVRYTRPFPGVKEMLAKLTEQGFQWGIVTNKPTAFTQPLLANYDLLPKTNYVVSGDTLPRAKPYPDPLLHACTLIGCQPKECVFIGDAQQDIIAGKAAGMRTLIALYGYLAEHDQPHTWEADGSIQDVQEILPWVENYCG